MKSFILQTAANHFDRYIKTVRLKTNIRPTYSSSVKKRLSKKCLKQNDA